MSEVLFEDRSTYDPAVDSVALCTLVVECNPGNALSIRQFLAGAASQAGVYSVAFESIVNEPVAAPAAEPESAQADAAEPSSSVVAVADEQSAAEPAQGASDGEQLLQQADRHDQPTDIGEGRVSEAGGTAEVGVADTGGGVAGPAGQGIAEPESGSAG